MRKSTLAILIAASLTACDSNNESTNQDSNTAATFSGDLTATIDADVSSVDGSIDVTDPDDNEESIVALSETTTYADFTIDADGEWTYTLDTSNDSVIALAENDTISDSITIESVDATTTTLVININGINDTPTFGSGDSVDSLSIANTQSESVSGSLTISDPDDNESSFDAQTDTSTTYGTFSIDSSGAWSYTLDVDNTSVVSLSSESDTLSDTILVESVDGTSTNIVITIYGENSSSTTSLTQGYIGDNDSVPSVSCTTTVSSISELEEAVSYDMTPGETLCLASGSYTGLELSFGGTGTEDSPITVAAEVPGTVYIDGEVFIGMTGQFVVLQGFIFQDGTMDSSLVQTRANSNTECNYCRITENSFIDMDADVDDSTKWFQIYGAYNRFDHNWVSGKTSAGALLIIERGDEGTEDHTQIDHNYFGDRPPKDGLAYAESSDNEYEGIRVGTSATHTSDSFAVIEHNYFEAIDGEAEVISIKAGNVTVQHNTIRNSRGSIVSRHGENSTIDNNFIIGDGNPYAGGIRLVDANHTVTNNYIEGGRYDSSNFYGGILVSNSDGSTTNGYQDVENVFIAYNTIVDSVNSINFAAGNESTSPDYVYFVNNIVDDGIGAVIVNADSLPTNYVFTGNYVHGVTLSDDDLTTLDGFTYSDPLLEADDNSLARPSDSSPDLTAVQTTYIGDHSLPSVDMDGQSRSTSTVSGADESSDEVLAANDMRGLLSKDIVGPLSYTPPTTDLTIQSVTIDNANFDTGDLSYWSFTNVNFIDDLDETFSRTSSVELSGADGYLAQTLAVEENTNYTLSAFVKGTGALTATFTDTSYTTDVDSSDYDFTTLSFNSGSNTSVVISGSLASEVESSVSILNADFDDDQTNWVVNEGTGIGQVQDSDNSASGDDGSIKFKYNDDDSGDPYDPYIAQTVTVEANTDYTLEMYVLLKSSDSQDATVLFGVHTGDAIVDGVFDSDDILASKEAIYADLDEDEEGDDDFRPDRVTFNSGDNTSLTIFAQYQSTEGDDIRIDDFSLTSTSAPSDDDKAYFDEFRLVSHPSLE